MTSDSKPITDRYQPSVPSPDSMQHLTKIQDEVRNEPPCPPKFHGINSIIKLGFSDDGALNLGFNLGIVKAEAKVGAVNGADAGVNLGPILKTGAGAFVGVDENGFHGNARAGAKALELIGAGGAVDARLGDATGASVAAGAHVGDIGAKAGVGAGLGEDGLDAAVAGRARAGRLAGAHAGGHFGLGDDSELAVGGGAHLGDTGFKTAVGVYDDGISIRPDIAAKGWSDGHSGVLDLNPAIYPPADAQTPAPATADKSTPSDATQYKPKVDSPIEVKPLPPIHEDPTPENVKKAESEILTKLCHQFKYTAQRGDTYESIAAKLKPNADQATIDKEAAKLKQMNESNGYKELHNGLVLNTEDPYTIEKMMRQQVAERFGWKQPS
ncbi:MAG TPA: hypothetical protein V6C97_24810 [Oculatellaceae cyanobacterium]